MISGNWNNHSRRTQQLPVAAAAAEHQQFRGSSSSRSKSRTLEAAHATAVEAAEHSGHGEESDNGVPDGVTLQLVTLFSTIVELWSQVCVIVRVGKMPSIKN